MLKKVFNWSEVHLSEMSCYKIHTLAMENTSDQSTIFGSDRGWNDPPPRLDTTASATTGSSGARLNKRVGFPSSFTSQSSDVKTDQMPLCDAGAKSMTGSL